MYQTLGPIVENSIITMKSPKQRAKKLQTTQDFDELAFLQTPRPSVIISAGEYILHYNVLAYFFYLPRDFYYSHKWMLTIKSWLSEGHISQQTSSFYLAFEKVL